MSSVRLSWSCGARDNASLKKLCRTYLPTRGRLTPSRPRSKVGKCCRCRARKAGRIRSFWTPPIVAWRREKVKKCRRSKTTRESNKQECAPAQNVRKLGGFGNFTTKIRSVPDPKNHGTLEQ